MSRLALVLALLLPPAVAPTAEPLCRNGFYLVQERELVRFDERGDRHLPVSSLPAQVNALAYLPKEEMFYGVAGKRFVTITSAGELTDRGPVPQDLEGAYAAATLGEHWIVQGGHSIVTHEVPSLTAVATVPLSPDFELGDWDVNPDDKMLYGVTAGRQPQLIQIDPRSGAVKEIAAPAGLPPGSSYGAAAIDLYGTLQVLHNSTGRIFRVPLADPSRATSVLSGFKAFHADAAACPAAFDLGNDPESDARHSLTTFGTLSIGALAGADDGLGAPPTIAAAATSLSVEVKVVNTTGQPALLAGWHDLNHDGQFTVSERTMVTVSAEGAVTLTWPQLEVNTARDESRLRLRLFGSVNADPQPHGFASGGEVEDYPLTVRWPEPRPYEPPPASPSPEPSLVPPPPPVVEPMEAMPEVPKPPERKRIPLTLTLFAGLLVPAVTVAARGGRKGAR